MGGADRVAEGRTEGPCRPQGGEPQAVEELQRALGNLPRRQERVERAEQEGRRHGEGGGPEGRPPPMPFRRPAIPPEEESKMQERAWRCIRGEAVKLAEKDREVVAHERRVREEVEAVARGAHRVVPNLEGDTPSTDVEGRSLSRKRGREEGGQAGQERGKRPPWRSGEQGEPEPGADASRLGIRVATAAAICATATMKGARDGRGVDCGGRGGASSPREVRGEDEWGTGEAGDPPLGRPRQQGGEAQGKGV